MPNGFTIDCFCGKNLLANAQLDEVPILGHLQIRNAWLGVAESLVRSEVRAPFAKRWSPAPLPALV